MIDTIDLQDQNAPSAKDHRPRAHSPSEGIAPHQEQSIRHADHDLRSEIMHGPGGDDYDEHGGLNGDGGYDHQHSSEDGDLGDEDVDDLLDDDLMDKISSSPSIDDGAWLTTNPSLHGI